MSKENDASENVYIGIPWLNTIKININEENRTL